MKKYKDLFLQQSYVDAYSEYEHSLSSKDAECWDYVVLTASNESQAQSYRTQLKHRLEGGYLPARTTYLVFSDPDGKRVGSGGATLNVLREIAKIEQSDCFDHLKILVIHSGGDSKRIPQYSACGKIFSPIPRALPDGRCSTIFDEFIIGLSGVSARIPAGMLVASGDVLLLLNSLQIDFCNVGAAALSIKESPETGANHGVYKVDKDGNVGSFLHKKTPENLRAMGAVDPAGKINIDTGAVILDSHILNDLWQLVKDDAGFSRYVNDHVRLSFYADFLFPMASESTFESYLKETPEGDFSPELDACRKVLWDILHPYRIRLIRLSPASFIHFGTTHEMLQLMQSEIEQYGHLSWARNIHTNNKSDAISARNSYISAKSVVGEGSYLEDSMVHAGCVIGKNCIVSGLRLQNVVVPDNTVLHGLQLADGRYTVRHYGINDNPKLAVWFGDPIEEPLWTAPVHPVCATMEEAVQAALCPAAYTGEKISLQTGFNLADGAALLRWQDMIWEKTNVEIFLDAIRCDWPGREAVHIFDGGISDYALGRLVDYAEKTSPYERIRIFHALSQMSALADSEQYWKKCFEEIRLSVLQNTLPHMHTATDFRICKDSVEVALPVRVNWGGGWSDTPPYCVDHGGDVLNAAVLLRGELPVHAFVQRVDGEEIILACEDNGSRKVYTDLNGFWNTNNPFDQFAIQKAALTVLGILPSDRETTMSELLRKIGGGFSFVTSVRYVPRGSGLGTSSILAIACVKALSDFFGLSLTEADMYSAVLCMEQLMSTGGGWQDQIGGFVPGIKMIHSAPGLPQEIQVEPVTIPAEAMQALSERFVLIYTGQRRLARNLLRDVVGSYIARQDNAEQVFPAIRRIAAEMQAALQKGDIDAFAKLLNEHWEYSKLLDSNCTNTCIEHIFSVCEEFIDGKMICGAGGGGFLQVVLKKGVRAEQLSQRLTEVYADSGVAVWPCSFYCGDQ